jgi:hypothetical protein
MGIPGLAQAISDSGIMFPRLSVQRNGVDIGNTLLKNNSNCFHDN